ncbi:MAG: hypothetical protein IJU57_03425 [Clostridia bacterium]|nr:hypothetical protein [Clostridia bacterium]
MTRPAFDREKILGLLLQSPFEPLCSKVLMEHIIFRRGSHIWNDPRRYYEAMSSFSERIGTEIVYANLRKRDRLFADSLSGLYYACGRYTLGVTKDHEKDRTFLDQCHVICSNTDAPYLKEEECINVKIYGDIGQAIEAGFDIYLAQSDCERYLEDCSDRIIIAGGLGLEYLNSTQPNDILKRIRSLRKKYGERWICGSGDRCTEETYLGFITMLSAFDVKR